MVSTHSYVRGSLLTNILDIWSYRLYGQFFTGPNVDHIYPISTVSVLEMGTGKTVQGDTSGCAKPPVDFNLITRHVNSGEYSRYRIYGPRWDQ